MNKTQVIALIRVLDNDTRKEYLRYAYIVLIKKRVYLVGTNNYCAFALELDQSFKDRVGTAIHINEFLIWKAVNRGRGKNLDLNDLAVSEHDYKTTVNRLKEVLIQQMKIHKIETESKKFAVNPKYINDMQQINGSELTWHLHGNGKPLTSLTSDSDFYMIYPYKISEEVYSG